MKLIFVELNELNFDYVKKYLDIYELKFLNKIINEITYTSSENEYKLLEPWIQWESIHTGCTAAEHKVFRLGDSVFSNKKQIFKELDEKKIKVGVIASMNARNNLENASYFIPDPWIQTESDKSFFSKLITKVVRDLVNNNSSGQFSKLNYIYILLIFFRFVRPKKYTSFLLIFYKSFTKKWFKPLFLDKLLHEIHLNLFKKKKPNFSCIFFNGAAHIQHHYLLNSLANTSNIKNPKHIIKNECDPFKDAILVYDEILKDYLIKDTDLIIATGLTQKIFHKKKYYYRLIDHNSFLNTLELEFKNIYPRMSRDFLITFNDDEHRNHAYDVLRKIKFNKIDLFGIIDKRRQSLFVTLTYNKEIYPEDVIIVNNKKINLYDNTTFVALKNGYHNAKGFFYSKGRIKNKFYNSNSQTLKIFDVKDKIKDYFFND